MYIAVSLEITCAEATDLATGSPLLPMVEGHWRTKSQLEHNWSAGIPPLRGVGSNQNDYQIAYIEAYLAFWKNYGPSSSSTDKAAQSTTFGMNITTSHLATDD